MATLDDNKKLVQTYFDEVWNQGRADAIDAMCAPNGIVHDLNGAATSGLAALKAFHAKFHSAFSNPHVAIDDLVAEGDRVVVRWTRTATHSGEAYGLPGSGRGVTFSGASIFRIENGKLVEAWNYYDRLGMIEQIGRRAPSATL